MELAEQAGLSLTLVSETERCLKWPRPESLEAIAKVLGVRPTELFIDNDLVLERVKEALNEHNKK